ncbi:glycoside hydrolase superfamily [Xylariaceae sp. FL0016]|nr:glycoside hydrolase superfamily [Xylariaceae sp. FL0016]
MASCLYFLRLAQCLLIAMASATSIESRATWPNGPFGTSGRWMTDATGTKVTYAGVNWPGSLDAMIPEGLQYQSIENIVSKIKGLGMNAIRLTYAIEMIDQYYDNGESDITMQKTLTDALGQDDGMDVYNQVVANNPSFGTYTTRLQVFDAVAEECAKQHIYVHLDNHVSKAGWCCSPLDGNSWWGDENFNVDNWTRGLSFMADHGKSWSNLMSMSLRNELRIPLTDTQLASSSYNWEDWYKYVQQGADAIHSANSDVLIFLSGLDSDKNLAPVVDGTALTPGSGTFNRDDFDGYGDKLVLELHSYDNILGTPSSNCSETEEGLFDDGFLALNDSATNQFPVVMTEFGFAQNESLSEDPYATCLLSFLPEEKAGWMIWTLSGSYYIREGTKDYDDQWGLLTHDWSGWKAPGFVNGTLAPAAKATLSDDGTTPEASDDDAASGGSSGNGSSGEEGSAASLSQNALNCALPVLILLAVWAY